MRYFATIAGTEHTIDVEPIGDTRFRVSIDGGPPEELDAERLEGGTLSLLAGLRSYDVQFDEDGDSLQVLVEDDIVHVDIVDERKRRLQGSRGSFTLEGPQVVRAPMPGKIVKLLVAPGDTVADGQGLVIIEAMKMENELRAPKAGVVTKIAVQEGQTVEGKTELVTIE